MKKLLSACVLMATLALAGCSQLPVKQNEAESGVTPEVNQNSSAEVNPSAQGLMGIRLEVEKTGVQPFLELLGEPLKIARGDEKTVVFLYQSNRLLSGKQNDTPLLIVLPENDPRANALPLQTLLLEFHQKNQAWVLAGLRMEPSPPKSEAPAKNPQK